MLTYERQKGIRLMQSVTVMTIPAIPIHNLWPSQCDDALSQFLSFLYLFLSFFVSFDISSDIFLTQTAAGMKIRDYNQALFH